MVDPPVDHGQVQEVQVVSPRLHELLGRLGLGVRGRAVCRGLQAVLVVAQFVNRVFEEVDGAVLFDQFGFEGRVFVVFFEQKREFVGQGSFGEVGVCSSRAFFVRKEVEKVGLYVTGL